MSKLVGSSTNDRAEVLRSPIPPGGFGRRLTTAEERDLRALGWTISNRSIVTRQSSDTPSLGIVYRPDSSGAGWSHAGIYVRTM